jgi:hypothetical protein
MGRECTTHGREIDSSLVVNLNRPLERPRRSWKNNTKIEFYEMFWNVVEWTYLTHDVDRLLQKDSAL